MNISQIIVAHYSQCPSPWATPTSLRHQTSSSEQGFMDPDQIFLLCRYVESHGPVSGGVNMLDGHARENERLFNKINHVTKQMSESDDLLDRFHHQVIESYREKDALTATNDNLLNEVNNVDTKTRDLNDVVADLNDKLRNFETDLKNVTDADNQEKSNIITLLDEILRLEGIVSNQAMTSNVLRKSWQHEWPWANLKSLTLAIQSQTRIAAPTRGQILVFVYPLSLVISVNLRLSRDRHSHSFVSSTLRQRRDLMWQGELGYANRSSGIRIITRHPLPLNQLRLPCRENYPLLSEARESNLSVAQVSRYCAKGGSSALNSQCLFKEMQKHDSQTLFNHRTFASLSATWSGCLFRPGCVTASWKDWE